MTFEEFNKFSMELLDEVLTMRDTKGKEYARSADRFANFNRLSDRLKMDRQRIWLVYFIKHLDAIESHIENGRVYSGESIRGRIVDAITYLTLLAGMIAEEQAAQTQLDLHHEAHEVPLSAPYAGSMIDKYRDDIQNSQTASNAEIDQARDGIPYDPYR